ncbi:MAG: periplasmic heavy metal sensor [Verrucomicrobiaceae bacterium]|nr:periplasmic heavy metal sensor [Verrucomicrobiaceae bacterium]
MKRGLLIVFVALLVGVTGFVVTRRQCSCERSATATHDGGTLLPELEWLHHEMKLSDEQFAKVSAMHRAYRPTCEALCMKVATAHNKVMALAATGNIASPELEAALQQQAAVHLECQRALLKHLHETAAVMSPEQSKKYLDAMLPQIIGTDAAPMSGGH